MKIKNKILFFAFMGFLLGSNTLCADIIYTNIIGATVGSDGYCTLDGLHVGFADSYSRFGIGIGLGSVLFPISGNELELTRLSSRSSGASLFQTNQWELISFLPVEIYFIPIMWNKTVINSGVFNSFGYGNDPVGNIFLYSRFIPFSKLQVDSMESSISSFKEFYEYGIGISFGEYIMFKIGNRHISFSPYTFEGDNKYKFTGLQKDSFYAGLNIYFGQWAAESTAESGFIPWIKGTVNNVVVDPYKNAKKRKRDSLFESIAIKNNEQLISLLNKGINPNIKDDSGKSALVYAIDHDNADAMKILIAKGASVNEKGPGGKTPLIYTIKANKPQLMQLLLENNVSINDKNDQGQTALYYAVDTNNIDFVKALVAKGANLAVRDNQELAPLSYSKDLIMSKYLIEKGADINCKDNSGKSLLMQAIEKDDKSTVNILIQAGIDINIKDNKGNSALVYAIKMGNFDQVKLLLNNRVDINSRDFQDRTPIFATREENILKLLLNNGANINSIDTNGQTALMVAIIEKEVKAAMLFISNGINTSIKDKSGKSAENFAFETGSSKLEGLFLKKYQSNAPFDFTLNKFQNEFLGDDIIKIYKKLSKLIPSQDEYETTDEYNKRTQSIKYSDQIYLFTKDVEKTDYDADTSRLTFTIDTADHQIIITSEGYEISSYIAYNAFGVATTVERTRGTLYYIELNNRINNNINIDLNISRNKAPKIRKNLYLAFICKTSSANSAFYNFTRSKPYKGSKPDMGTPYDYDVESRYLNVDLLEIWVYDYTTGEILKKEVIE